MKTRFITHCKLINEKRETKDEKQKELEVRSERFYKCLMLNVRCSMKEERRETKEARGKNLMRIKD